MKSFVEIPTFLKWAGGKRRILPLLDRFFPKVINRYFEPFLGGGSVFFYIKAKYNPSECVISDTNRDLVNTYLHVRDNPRELIKRLSSFKKNHSKEFYYSVRERFNGFKYDGVERSAAFIYLNKTCFNGLYRVNSKNEFNVPFGQLKNPGIFEESIIYHASEILKDGVKIKHQDYQKILGCVGRGDFVYLDPCYDPLKKTSFANYTPERFSEDDRVELHTFIESLRKARARVVLSNNDISEIRKLYSKRYNINEITAPRFIGSRASYRSSLTELVISTY
ncbi:MAG: Dam family site-specific DNA-(adenine-N6)-methyltransferase [bacterium]|nr:Dam family site-specific DNA-(adenine-N6)-methyltransferase [bacterium]